MYSPALTTSIEVSLALSHAKPRPYLHSSVDDLRPQQRLQIVNSVCIHCRLLSFLRDQIRSAARASAIPDTEPVQCRARQAAITTSSIVIHQYACLPRRINLGLYS